MIHQKGFLQKIIIFTRYPIAGQTKTRLIPELGAEGAAHLQRAMTERVVLVCREMIKRSNLCLEVHFTGGSVSRMQKWLGKDIEYRSQKGDDLGERMHNAFTSAWQNGAKKAVIIGSDCPCLDAPVIEQALQALDNNQLVVGPSADGGYYLIGTTSDLPEKTLSALFFNFTWGSDDVFQETINRARDNSLKTATLKKLHDIDLPDDLKHFDYHPNP